MERIIEKNSSTAFKSDYQRYGIYITFRRVVPDYRDGLKPVQRRILYAMLHDTKCIKRTVKCAAIVGDVMKYYHPHGNTAIYGTMKPMANWFEASAPTITSQGGFGNFQGDPPSADRYTEARLSEFAMDCVVGDLKESDKAVDWSPNYDESCYEPDYLPCTVPLLLINGSFGIGLGKRVEIPSHNLSEVVDATLALIENPNRNITLTPDHCMDCEIYATDFADIAKRGFGYYRVRGVIETENYHGSTALVIKSVPNLTFLNEITDKIDKLIIDKKIIQIQAKYDESTELDMRYVIVLKPGADPEYVKEVIYKNTSLERTERVNFEVLDGLNPFRMSYKSYLLSFIDQRKVTKFRIYTNKLQGYQTKLHEKEAYIKLLQSGEIDFVINYLKSSKVKEDDYIINYLVKKLSITDLQARYIINAPLKSLNRNYLDKYVSEAKELQLKVNDCMYAITNENRILQDIVEELKFAKQKYGSKRRCKIIRAKEAVDDIPRGMMTIIVTEKNFIKKVPVGTNIGTFKGDMIRTIITEDNAESILVFDEMGKVFKLPIHKIPFTDRNSNGMDIRFLIKGLTSNILTIVSDNLIKAHADKDEGNNNYMVALSKSGLVKKMILSDFTSVPPSGILYTKLEPNDYVVSLRLVDDSSTMLVFNDRKVMALPMSKISLMKRNSRGNKTFKDTSADGILTIDPTKSYILTLTETGRFNKIPIEGLPDINRAKKMFGVIKLGKNDVIKDILTVNDDEIIEVTTMNSVFRVNVADVRTGSSISSGEKMITLKGDKILRSYQLSK